MRVHGQRGAAVAHRCTMGKRHRAMVMCTRKRDEAAPAEAFSSYLCAGGGAGLLLKSGVTRTSIAFFVRFERKSES